ncbi:MAG: DUF4272 domain-containing protein [Oscillospiraceae bacterium]|nr:DUF4272 domain-containing protein [Oscillospiraceae bacterium]
MSMANTRKALSRKRRSENFLIRNGVKIDPNFPEIMNEKNASIKAPEEAVRRAVCAFLTARIAAGIYAEDSEAIRLCADIIDRLDLVNELTGDERKYFELAVSAAACVSVDEAEQFHWRTEMSMPLLWACGFLGEHDLAFPAEESYTEGIFKTLSGCKSFSEVMSYVKMHTDAEILDNADVCSRMQRACMEAHNKNRPAICGDLMADVVREQLKGFCWLVGLTGAEDWDKIDL